MSVEEEKLVTAKFGATVGKCIYDVVREWSANKDIRLEFTD